MEKNTEKIDRLEKALKTAYQEGESISLKDGWQPDVMREIRRLHFSKAESNLLTVFARLAWRLIPITCLLIIMVSAGLLFTDFSPEYEAASMYINSPFNYDIFLNFDLM